LPEGGVLAGRIRVDGAPPKRPLALRLSPAESVHDTLGLPDEEPLTLVQADLARGASDAQGGFVFRGLAPARGYTLCLPAGSAPPDAGSAADPDRTCAFHLFGPARGLVFDVERLESVHGRIVEQDGRPVSAAEVWLRFRWLDGSSCDESARADERG